MKFLSWIALIAFAAWTFQLSAKSQALPTGFHGFLAGELKALMTNHLENNVPDLQDITFHRLYTEEIEPAKHLKAYVKYSYDSYTESGNLTREMREGEFDLASSDGGLTWELTVGDFREINLEFLDGIRIVPGQDLDEEAQGDNPPAAE